jgi:hypothetical protein
MSIRLGFYGLGNGKDIWCRLREQARPMEKENAIWSTYMDEKQIG